MKQKLNINTENCIRFAAFTVLFGRAWEHWFFNPPFHAVIWDYNISGWFVEGFLGIPWNDFLTNAAYDDKITLVVKSVGVFYALTAVLSLLSDFRHKWSKVTLVVSTCLLTLLACMEMFDKFNASAQLLEHTSQAAAPVLLLLLVSRKSLTQQNLVTVFKVLIALTFIGHGVYALGYYKQPSVFILMIRNTIGVSYPTAVIILKIIGVGDILGALLLFFPNMKVVKIALGHLMVWGFITAFGRIVGLVNWEQFSVSFQQLWFQTIYRLPHGLLPLALFGLLDNKTVTKQVMSDLFSFQSQQRGKPRSIELKTAGKVSLKKFNVSVMKNIKPGPLNSVLALVVLLFGFTQSIGSTDKYRLTYRDDPSTSIVVGFNVIDGSNQTVYYGTTNEAGNLNNYPFSRGIDRQVTYRGMKNTFVRLSNLQPKTRYYFVVADDNSTSNVMYFETVTDDVNDTISFIAGGDSRKDNGAPDAAILWGNEMVKKLKPDAVLFGGDMTNTATDAEWKEWFDDWQFSIGDDGRMTPIVATQGNHESGPAMIINLFDTPDQDAALAGNHAYYALTFGGGLVRSYTLNSDEAAIVTDQAQWLESDLQAHSEVYWKMAQYHQPIAPHKTGKPYRTDLYSNWANLFYDYGVRLVVECDAHVVKETEPVIPTGSTSDENRGFEYDPNGTYYAGEGTWRAIRSIDVNYPFTKASGSFNQVKWLIVSKSQIEMRTVKTQNVDAVSAVSEDNRFIEPAGLEVWNNEPTVIVPAGPPPPRVTVLSPLDNSNFPTVQTVTMAAHATDYDGFIDQIDFYVNNNLVGSQFGAPYSLDYYFDQEGEYEVKMVATDNDGQTGEKTVTITIGEIPFEIDVQVNKSSDDAEESLSGVMSLTSSDIEMTADGSTIQLCGLRFENITLPVDAQIQEAYVVFTVDEAGSANSSLTISGELDNNPVTYSGVNKISSRTKTSNSVSWSPSAWLASDIGNTKQSADIATILNELISQPGYVSGNPMAFIIEGTGNRIASSYDLSAGLAPRLYIKYQSATQERLQKSCVLNDEFKDESTLFAIDSWAGFQLKTSNDHLVITSTGHDQWATIDYAFNDGLVETPVSLYNYGPPILRVRARASSPCVFNASLKAGNITAQNTTLQGINEIELSEEFQILEIDFEGKLWDEWVNIGATLDQSAISKIVFAVNQGYTDYPHTGSSGTVYTNEFIGDIEIDWIRFGQDCQDCFLIPNGIGELDKCGECGLLDDPAFNECTTGLFEEEGEPKNLVYPTQFTDFTFLHGTDLEGGLVSYQIVDAQGDVLVDGSSGHLGDVPIGMSLPHGVYTVVISTERHQWTNKIIKLP